MGAQQSQSFGYDVGPQSLGGFSDAPVWSLHEGVRKADGTKVSVFVFDAQKQPALVDIARNTMKRLKTMRHPSLVTYLDGLELPTTFYVVTECVTPLRDVLADIVTNEHHLSWGLSQVLKGLQFLNGDCQLVHGNVTLSSIFVNRAGDWKLGGLEFVSSASESAPALKKQLELVDSKYHSPEVKRDAAAALQKMAPHTIDMYMYGCLLYEVFNGPFKGHEDLIKPRNIPQALAQQYRALVSTPKGRLEPAQLAATCKYFSNPLVDALQFLENVALKDSHEKDAFFGKLGNQIDHFPKQLCTQKILPSLVTALDYGYANSRALGPLLKIGAQLPPEDYVTRITPSVVKWFGSTDREMRTNLLSNIESFAEHLTPSLVNEKIFGNLALGFSDLSPKLRELTIRSIVVLAPKLSSGLLNTEVLRHFARLQLDKEPYIRTNTTICLGRIAQHLAPATRKKVLASAFARSLRDPFPPARVAGLMAFTATHEYYDVDEVAKKVVPCLSMLAVDSEKQVRTAALQGLHLFVEKLEKHSESMRSTPDPSGGDPASAGLTPSGEGLFGWALGSLSKKIYGEGEGEGGKGATSTLAEQQKQPPTTPIHGPPASSFASTSGSNSGSSTTSKINTTKSTSSSSKGGWSDIEEDSDDDWGGAARKASPTGMTPSATGRGGSAFSSAKQAAPASSTGRLSSAIAAEAEEGGNNDWGDGGDWGGKEGSDDGWGADDDDWGGIPEYKQEEEDEGVIFQPPKKPVIILPTTATTGSARATAGTGVSTQSVRPTMPTVGPASPSAEKRGIPGLRRAEPVKPSTAASASSTSSSPSPSSSFTSSATKPVAASSSSTSLASLSSAKKPSGLAPTRSLSSPTKPGISVDDDGIDGWGDDDGWGNDDDEGGWDFPASTSPATPVGTKGATPAPSSTAPSSMASLSKLEQRALLRNQKKTANSKKD